MNLVNKSFFPKRLANNFDNNKQHHLIHSGFFATTNKNIQTLKKNIQTLPGPRGWASDVFAVLLRGKSFKLTFLFIIRDRPYITSFQLIVVLHIFLQTVKLKLKGSGSLSATYTKWIIWSQLTYRSKHKNKIYLISRRMSWSQCFSNFWS